MKSFLYLVIALMLLGSSCRMMNVPETRTASDPYVQLKNGKKFEGSSAEKKSGLFKEKIVLGDTSFRSRDVAFYSTGGMTYANIGRRTFAHQVATGKINLYKYSSTTTSTSFDGHGGSSTSTSHHISYYIQKGDGTAIKSLSYRNLAPMVQSNTTEFKMLNKFRNTRTVSRILGYGSLGLIGTGVILAGSNNNSTSNLGATAVGVGVAALVGWMAVYIPNRMRLLKTVIIADKPDKEYHKRVR